MKLHLIQEKLLQIAEQLNLKKMSLRDIGLLVDESHPQKVSHHLKQLEKKGFIEVDEETGEVRTVDPDFTDNLINILSVPIFGSANCGEADIFAEENLEGYLKVSKSLAGKAKKIFAIRASGNSMNKAKIAGKYSIDSGDYVLIDPNDRHPRNGDYVLSVINGCANIKKFLINEKEGQIALVSESTENFLPIYIHQDDNFIINGIVKNVIKNSSFKELADFEISTSAEVLKSLEPVTIIKRH